MQEVVLLHIRCFAVFIINGAVAFLSSVFIVVVLLELGYLLLICIHSLADIMFVFLPLGRERCTDRCRFLLNHTKYFISGSLLVLYHHQHFLHHRYCIKVLSLPLWL